MEIVSFKGTKDGIELSMNRNAHFDEILSSTVEKFSKMRNFFVNSTINIKFCGKELSDVQKALLQTKIWDLLGDDANVEFSDAILEKVEVNKVRYDDNSTKFHRGTLRSGQTLESAGNVIIVGDANPGSEIIAGSNVVVLGALKGVVHAGANGSRDAIVIALNMQPTQLRIADVITRPPDEDDRKAIVPEIAYLNGSEIYLEQLERGRIG